MSKNESEIPKIEYAKSGRAKCRGCQNKIQKEMLRVGISYPYTTPKGEVITSFRYYHMECIPNFNVPDVISALEKKPMEDSDLQNRIIKQFKPFLVLGVGGYASGPLMKMAFRKKIPGFLQEQNSYPGITNKLLAKKAEKIFVAYEGMNKYFNSDKLILSGNPVRQDLENMSIKSSEAYEFFGFDKKGGQNPFIFQPHPGIGQFMIFSLFIIF